MKYRQIDRQADRQADRQTSLVVNGSAAVGSYFRTRNHVKAHKSFVNRIHNSKKTVFFRSKAESILAERRAVFYA